MGGAAKNWGHDELAIDLGSYLSGPETMVWTNMQLGPSGSPRPDVYTLRRSYSKPHPMAFECKISRSDLRSDTTSGKWQSYLRYAAGVVFAVPDGLCTVADIPDVCGLIVRKAEVWRYVRRPTLQKVTPPFDACMKLLIDGVSRTHQSSMPTPRRLNTWGVHAAVLKRFGKDVAEAARDLTAARNRISSMKEQADAEWERIEAVIKVRAETLRQQYAKEEAEWSSARSDLLTWLGLPPSPSLFAVRRAIDQLKRECSVDHRVADAEGKLSRARHAVETALNALPPARAYEVPPA